MRVSPQCFSILTHMLKGVAQGRLVLALEVWSYYAIRELNIFLCGSHLTHSISSVRVGITSSPQQRVFALVWGHCWVTLALTWPLLVLRVRGEWTEEHICLCSLTFLSVTPYFFCGFILVPWTPSQRPSLPCIHFGRVFRLLVRSIKSIHCLQ